MLLQTRIDVSVQPLSFSLTQTAILCKKISQYWVISCHTKLKGCPTSDISQYSNGLPSSKTTKREWVFACYHYSHSYTTHGYLWGKVLLYAWKINNLFWISLSYHNLFITWNLSILSNCWCILILGSSYTVGWLQCSQLVVVRASWHQKTLADNLISDLQTMNIQSSMYLCFSSTPQLGDN